MATRGLHLELDEKRGAHMTRRVNRHDGHAGCHGALLEHAVEVTRVEGQPVPGGEHQPAVVPCRPRFEPPPTLKRPV